jgi:endoglucanase
VDKLGNIIAHKKGSGNGAVKILMAAHMDEIGFMVKDIDKKGFIHFTNIGGIDPRTILAQEVIIHGKEEVLGVIGSKPPHLQDSSEQEKSIKMEDMIIDTGYEKEDLGKLVSIGDSITVSRRMVNLMNGRVSGKAMDDRAGVAALYETMMELKGINHYADVYFVATIQEEITMAGALTASYGINPDIGIAVDVGFGRTPELNNSNSIEMGKGPGITLGGNIHPGLRKRLVKVASDYNVPIQTDVRPGPTGTDARAMQITREGIPALVLSIPLRYMHTSVEVLDLKDVSYTAKLLAFFSASIKEDEMEGLLCF